MKKITSLFVLVNFIVSCIMPPHGMAQTLTAVGLMPQPGVQVSLTPAFTPAHLKGMVINPTDPFKFDFIVSRGDEVLTATQKQDEYSKLIKYFLAALAVPDTDQWVNLSPYEKDRIIPDGFGLTEMGRDLLAQDYLLKQISASLTNPDTDLGKKFWNGVYEQAYQKYGTTDIPTDTFNKVWITPDKAVVYEKGNSVVVLEHHLKVMLESDYKAMKENSVNEVADNDAVKISKQVMREVIIPAIEKEVNEGKSFAPLRQVYSGMLLATWYKIALKESILGKLYADAGKVKGVDQDPKNNQEIYNKYVSAFKKGVFNMIKEDVDHYTQEVIPRKYFSGGTVNEEAKVLQRKAAGDQVAAVQANGVVADANTDVVSAVAVNAGNTVSKPSVVLTDWNSYQEKINKHSSFSGYGYSVNVTPGENNTASVEIKVPAVIGKEGYIARGTVDLNDESIAKVFERIKYDVANFGEAYGGPEGSVKTSLRELGEKLADRQVTEPAKQRTIDQVRSDLNYEIRDYKSMQLVEKKGGKATAREFVDAFKAAIAEAKQMTFAKSNDFYAYADTLSQYTDEGVLKRMAIGFFYNDNGYPMTPSEGRLQKKVALLEEFYKMRGDMAMVSLEEAKDVLAKNAHNAWRAGVVAKGGEAALDAEKKLVTPRGRGSENADWDAQKKSEITAGEYTDVTTTLNAKQNEALKGGKLFKMNDGAYVIQMADGAIQLDTLNTPYESLSPAWKGKNAATVEAAVVYYQDGLSRGFDVKMMQAGLSEAITYGKNGQKLDSGYVAGDALKQFMAEIGAREHDRWMKANDWMKGDKPELFVGFADLPASEQYKDLEGFKQLADFMAGDKAMVSLEEAKDVLAKNAHNAWRAGVVAKGGEAALDTEKKLVTPRGRASENADWDSQKKSEIAAGQYADVTPELVGKQGEALKGGKLFKMNDGAYVIQMTDGSIQLDTLNTPYESLSPAWKGKNAATVEAAVVYYQDGLSRGLDVKTMQLGLADAIARGKSGQKLDTGYIAGDALKQFLADVGAREHERWMKANDWMKGDKPELFVAFGDLPAAEQYKDLEGFKQLADFMVGDKAMVSLDEAKGVLAKNAHNGWRAGVVAKGGEAALDAEKKLVTPRGRGSENADWDTQKRAEIAAGQYADATPELSAGQKEALKGGKLFRMNDGAYVIQAQDGAIQLDTLNTPYESLSPAWKGKNAATVEAAVVYYQDGLSRGLDVKVMQSGLADAIARGKSGQKLDSGYIAGDAVKQFMAEVGSREHDRWMKANDWMKGDKPELFVAFADLPAAEQYKDLEGFKQLADFMAGDKAMVTTKHGDVNVGYEKPGYYNDGDGKVSITFAGETKNIRAYNVYLSDADNELGKIEALVQATIEKANSVAEAKQALNDLVAKGIEAVRKEAAGSYGGIDFAQSNLNMQIKRDGAGVPLPISQQNLDNIHIDGLVPVILNIRPSAGAPVLSQLAAASSTAV